MQHQKQGAKLSLEILRLTVPTHVQGLLKIDKQVVDMKCVDVPVAPVAPVAPDAPDVPDVPDAPEGQRDKQVNLWSGSEESDHPEGLYHVLAYRKGILLSH